MAIKYFIGEMLYRFCARLWAISKIADTWRGRTAHRAALLQEDYLKAKRTKSVNKPMKKYDL